MKMLLGLNPFGNAEKVLIEAGPSPAQNIPDCAEKEKVGLIIMRHWEKNGVDRFLIDSVAPKVMTHAPSAVLVVC